jgi:hypothetical protein
MTDARREAAASSRHRLPQKLRHQHTNVLQIVARLPRRKGRTGMIKIDRFVTMVY